MTPLEPAGPDELRAEIAIAAERFREATSDLRKTLDLADESIDSIQANLAARVPTLETLRRYEVAHVRETMTDAVSEFSRSRHHLRLAIFSLLIAEGMNSTELASVWGFSRQMAMKQMRKLSNLPDDFE